MRSESPRDSRDERSSRRGRSSKRPPGPPSSPKKWLTPFTYAAVVTSLTMFLIAAGLFVHVLQTKAWLRQIKADTAARALAIPDVSSKMEASHACPDKTPVLIGFDEKGRARCRALASQTCDVGQYIASIDPQTLEVHCASAGAEVSCATNSYITEFMWLGENRVSFSCNPRLDPFLAWKFEPVLGSKGNDL